MKKDVALQLIETVKRAGKVFSNPDREYNFTGETFTPKKITPLSETTAIAYYEKDTGKKAIFFFYYIRSNGGTWCYFVPTDSHILGMVNVHKYIQEVEEYNFEYNGSDENN